MSDIIAITGKGGTGKTTIAALLVRELITQKRGPVLAVDADPNSCLDIALGVKVLETIGSHREKTRELSSKGQVTGVSKQQMLEMNIAQSMVEADGFDLIAMGRPEGPGCYCYANNVLRQSLISLSSKYPTVVLDNEAGLENLSRRIVQKVSSLIIIADPSRQGMATIPRLHALAQEMGMSYDKLFIIINRVRQDRAVADLEAIKLSVGAKATLSIPDDSELAIHAEDGKSVFLLPAENQVVKTISEFVKEI